MSVIKSISCRKILNSHALFTNEFNIEFENGVIGIGASPQGETISIYEDKKISIDSETIINAIKKDSILGTDIDQASFDQYLQSQISYFGRNNAYGLSEAFFNANAKNKSIFDLFDQPKKKLSVPRISLNVLNGGWHAYTNPVLSDFSEFMLVAKSNNILEVMVEHNEIQRIVREKQLTQKKTVVSGNPVNCFSTPDNREVIDFLLEVVNDLGLSNKYDLMIDASAGDLWKDNSYQLGVTEGKAYSREEFIAYWMDLIKNYQLRFLEDPFHEKDLTSWSSLCDAQKDSYVIGDNLYSSDESRILDGASKKYANGAVIKPNQAGTVTGICRSLNAALSTNQIAITSHRSISTESTFISLLTCMLGAQFIKIGPLLTDYSSIVRLNEIIRLTEG